MQLLHIHIPRHRIWTFWRDDGEWKEEKHPRGKGGKFAKVGYEVSSKASALLKSHGYAKEKGAPLFKHSTSGETVMFHPPEKEGAKVSFHWGHYHPEHGELGTGHGLAALHQHLGGTGTASAVAQAGVKHKGAEPAAPAPAAPAPPTEAPKPQPLPGANLHPSYTNALKDKGFEFTGTAASNGAGLFVNKAGVHVKLLPPEEGKKSLSKWTVYSPAAFEGHEAGIFGEGMYDLLDAVAEAEKHPVPTPAAAPKPAVAPAASKPAAASFAPNAITPAGFSAAQTQYLENKGFKPNPHDPSHYSNEEGVHVYLDKPNDPKNPHNGGYSVYSPKAMAGEEPGDYGKGPLDLAQAVSKASGTAKAQAAAQPKAAPVTAPKGIEEVLPVSHAIEWPQLGDPATIYEKHDSYGNPDEQVLVSSNGQWKIWTKEDGTVAEGKGQESLNTEFEKLHPRGPGGKFQAKPGGAEPTQPKVPKSNKTESFTQGGPLPPELNGVKFTHFDAMAVKDWGQFGKPDLVEPPMQTLVGKHNSAGLLIQEPDGRIWIMHPKGGYGGTNATFPKGTIDPGETPQQAAIREAFEESGIVAQITGFAGDYEGTTSNNRYYFAKRVAGSPTDFGHETSKVTLVPPDELGKYLNQDRDKKIAAEHYPPAPPKQTIGHEIDPGTLKKVGPQLGSNPGFQGEDAEGNRYYVKMSKSPDHAKNELLAAALYDAAKSPILTYHPTPGDKGIVTDWQEPDKEGGVKALTPAERKMAKAEFAVHAWLANWDAAGSGGDNQQVIGGKPTTVDVGGALLYRAQGAPKGVAWGPSVGEWDTLRDPAKSPDAAGLFGDMTKDELQESVKKVAAISDAQIRLLVAKHGPADAAARQELSNTLVARRNDLVKRADALNPPKPLSPHELRAKIAGWNPPKKPVGAVQHYKGEDYKPMNALCRFFDMQSDDQSVYAKDIRAIDKWLDAASSQEPVTLYRGIKGDYHTYVRMVAAPGKILKDDGFVSMSASKQFADAWHGGKGLTMKITVPAGTKMATVREADSSDGEYEAIAARKTQFRITKWEPYSGTYEVELVQEHMKT